MKKIGNFLIIVGVVFISLFGYQFFSHGNAQKQSLARANEFIAKEKAVDTESNEPIVFKPSDNEAFATLEIPKLGKTLPIVEGTDADSLKKGVGHLSDSVFPGQNEQILLSGHRDTVFRDFGKLEIGDIFIVTMPYGLFEYEIKETEIVAEEDTSIIRDMGEEVLVVTTCYPFNFIGHATERFVIYAYPV